MAPPAPLGVLILALCTPALVAGCGFTTHNAVAHRASSFVDPSQPDLVDLVAKHTDAVQGGAPFPDYLYTCGTNHSAGETAHWVPFQVAAVNYLRSLPRPWSEHDEKVATFFFGLVSHYIADLNWHGLGGVPEGQGFIRTLGGADYACDGDLCSVAHTAADTGGEFMATRQVDISFYHPRTWFVPADDLIAIYALTGTPVEKEWILKCSNVFYIGSWAIKTFGSLIEPIFAKPSPFMTERYVDYYIGGLDDMAVWTRWMARRFWGWVQDGPPPQPYPPLLASHLHGAMEEHRRQFLDALRPLADMDGAHFGWHADASHQGSAHFRPPASPTDVPREAVPHLQAAFERLAEGHVRVSAAAAGVPEPSSAELADLRGRVRHAVAAAAAGDADAGAGLRHGRGPAGHGQRRRLGSADSLLSRLADAFSEWVLPGAQRPAATVAGDAPLAYLGAAAAEGDFDGDGTAEVAIGMPGVGGAASPFRGAVRVAPSGDPSAAATLIDSPEPLYARFGQALAALDLNGDGVDDLAVGAPVAGFGDTPPTQPSYPYHGAIFVYLGRRGSGLPATPDAAIRGDCSLTQLGHALAAADVDGDGAPDLLAGAPYAGPCGGHASGRGLQTGAAFVFRGGAAAAGRWQRNATGAAPTALGAFADADWVARGEQDYEWLGMAVGAAADPDSGAPLLLVGAPGFQSDGMAGKTGRLLAWRCSASDGPLTCAPALDLRGVEPLGKLGYAVGAGTPLGAATPALVVAAPSASPSDALSHAGLVYALDLRALLALGGGTSPNTTTPVFVGADADGVTLVRWAGDLADARLGTSVLVHDVDGDGEDDVLLAAPLADGMGGGSQAGVVLGWRGGAARIPTGDVGEVANSATWRMTGQSRSGRLGEGVLAAGSAGVLVSEHRATHPGHHGHMQGALHVFALQ